MKNKPSLSYVLLISLLATVLFIVILSVESLYSIVFVIACAYVIYLFLMNNSTTYDEKFLRGTRTIEVILLIGGGYFVWKNFIHGNNDIHYTINATVNLIEKTGSILNL